MKKFYNIFLVCISLSVFIFVGFYVYRRHYADMIKADIVNSVVDTNRYKPYRLGTNISFASDGNSREYVNTADGWGGQEPEHRCALGNQSVIRLYIPYSVGKNLRLVVDGFGVFQPTKYENQEVKIYVNDILLDTWFVSYDGPFTLDIPDGLITDNTLTLKFCFAHPYTPPRDSRKIGMAFRTIEIDSVFGAQTKRKIGMWIKKNLMGGGIKQDYGVTVNDEEEWL